ncbi:hypothetical protein ED733_002100 [Metarhizium rileyi]|uniref:Uncharacterized protein n=1 Tax=Metarhizium rileyi (strain RCEF 4871) TaxID=1649241 RepID=A0A5C6G4B9_METRR|nr:hypothetical protein ED733_002100 [Metarhizium rileyi]
MMIEGSPDQKSPEVYRAMLPRWTVDETSADNYTLRNAHNGPDSPIRPASAVALDG